MGSYLSTTWSTTDTAAPVLSKAEVEIDLAKQKIDNEVEEIVQAEILMEQRTSKEEKVIEAMTHDVDEAKIQEKKHKCVDEVPSSSNKSPEEPATTKKEKMWYHKFTGNVQRTDKVSLTILAERRIQAVEKRAIEQKKQLDKHLDQIETRNKIRLLALQQKIHPDFRGKEWRFDEKKNFNFAVVGCSGVGKSTFINSLLGLKPFQPGAARVSAGVEGTLVMQPYCMPDLSFIRIWDVPGGSGIDRPADTYFDEHCLDLFDAVLYLHEGRHNVLQAMILAGCIATNTPVQVIVTKMDLLVESQLENQGLEETPANIEEAIAVISETVTKECSSLNERFFQDNSSHDVMPITMPALAVRGEKQLPPNTSAHALLSLTDVPFFFVSKYFKSRFGSFDAEKVLAGMKEAASQRMKATTVTSPAPTAMNSSSPPQLPLIDTEEEEEKEEKPKPQSKAMVSPKGSPMPFLRASLKAKTISGLEHDLGVHEGLQGEETPPPPPPPPPRAPAQYTTIQVVPGTGPGSWGEGLRWGQQKVASTGGSPPDSPGGFCRDSLKLQYITDLTAKMGHNEDPQKSPPHPESGKCGNRHIKMT